MKLTHARLTKAIADIEDIGIKPSDLATAIIVNYDKLAISDGDVSLGELLDALRSYVIECDRPRGKFEAEHLYDVASRFFRG